LRILLVEDHSDSALTVAELLRKRGHEVQIANTAEAAIEYDPNDLDLLISDIGLPDGSGLDVITALRERGDVKAIALSGFGTETDVENSVRAGFAAHLTKPVSTQELFDAIARVTREPERPVAKRHHRHGRKTRASRAVTFSPPGE
jgi:CheY-like chemotaxis protein